MTTLLVLPIIDPDAAAACLATISPEVEDRVLIVDNCRRPFRTDRKVQVVREGRNLGVARSWNLGVKWALNADYDAVALVSAQVRFGHAGATDLLALDPGEWCALPPPTWWHTAVFTMRLFETIGTFDENFYPAHLEDTDWTRRALLAGVHFPLGPTIDAKPTTDGHGLDRLRNDAPGHPTFNFSALADYWREKWGCHHHDACDLDQGYRTPFDEGGPLWSWPVRTIEELCERYGIEER